MRFEIILAPEAIEDRKRLQAHDRAAIDDAMEVHLRHEPERVSKSRVKRLRALRHPQYRLRVDDFRVFYDVLEQEVQILGIVLKEDAADWLKAVGEPS